jgi:hypothetical protein
MLTGTSTDAEVWAAYDDNASYQEDASAAKANAFISACRILRRRTPLSAGRGGQSMSFESLGAEIDAAQRWLAANPSTSGAGSTRVRYFDGSDFRS